MKNISYSTILFSAFSPDVLLTPIKNKIKPITSSLKKLIKDKNQNKKRILMKSNSLYLSNTNKYNIFKNHLYNKYIIDKNKSSNYSIEDINYFKPKVLKSFYSPKAIKRRKKFSLKKEFSKDFIFIKPQRIKSTSPLFKKIKQKSQKFYIEPYKKYLNDKNKLEQNRKAKEIEMNYIIESKKQQRQKIENNIRNMYQGLDFSRQKKREFFLAKYLKSKQYKKRKARISTDEEENFIKQIDYQFLMKKLNFEINEKKYMFLENNDFVPRVKYSSFNEKLRNFLWNLRENPNISPLINYISKNK